MTQLRPSDWDAFGPEVRFLLDELIEEYDFGLHSENYSSVETLLDQAPDIARNWLFVQIRQTHMDWAVAATKSKVATLFDALRSGVDDGPDSARTEPATVVHPSTPFEGWPDGFEFIRELKPGGTSRVYLAIDRTVRRTIALKVPRPAVDAEDLTTNEITRIRNRFLREGKTLGELASNGIRAVPQFLQFVWVGELRWPVLVLEYVQDQSLERVLNASLPGFDTRTFTHLAQFARDLHAFHQTTHVHLDLKPSNIHLRGDGSWTALDWGFGRKHGDVASSESSPIAPTSPRDDDDLGATPRYMAPEQAKVESKELDGKTDVFALGAILHRVLTGLELLPSELGSSDLIQRIREGRFDEARARLVAMSSREPMAELALSCLATGPELRPDAATVAARIEDHLDALRKADEARAVLLAKSESRRWWATRVAGLLVILTPILVTLIVVAVNGRRAAIRSEQIAQNARSVAEQNQREAEAARAVADQRTRETRRSEFLREVEAADVALESGLFDRACKAYAQARIRPEATAGEKVDSILKMLRASMFLNDLTAVDEYLDALVSRPDLSPRQAARLKLELALRAMHRSMNEPDALTSPSERDGDRVIQRLLVEAEPDLDEADRLIVRGLLASTADEALVAYDSALARQPRHPYALAYALQTRMLAGRVEAALSQARTWAAMMPDDPLPWFYLAALESAQGRSAEADEAMRRFRAADGAGRQLGPNTDAQCAAIIRILHRIDEAIQDAAVGGTAALMPFLGDMMAELNLPGGWDGARLFTFPLPPVQRRRVGGYMAGTVEAIGLGPLFVGHGGFAALFNGAGRRRDALQNLNDSLVFVAPGQVHYFRALLLFVGLRRDESESAQLTAVGRAMARAATEPVYWDIRGIALYVSAGCDLRCHDLAMQRALAPVQPDDAIGRARALLARVHAAFLWNRAGLTMTRMATLPRLGPTMSEKLRELAQRHGDLGVIRAVDLLRTR